MSPSGPCSRTCARTGFSSRPCSPRLALAAGGGRGTRCGRLSIVLSVTVMAGGTDLLGVQRDGLTPDPLAVLRYFPCRSPGSFPVAHPPPGGRCTSTNTPLHPTRWRAARPGRAIGSSPPSQGGDCGFKSRLGYGTAHMPICTAPATARNRSRRRSPDQRPVHSHTWDDHRAVRMAPSSIGRRQDFQSCKEGSSPSGATDTRHGA